MQGRYLIIGLFIFVVLFGAGLFYAINFMHYTKTEHAEYEIAGLSVRDYQEINATSSPIKFRACFTVPENTDVYGDAEGATPLVAPYWFDCYDAEALTADIEAGEAHVVIYSENEPFGVSSYIAIYPDGRGVAWRQLNACGEARYSGEDIPNNCPTPDGEN